MTSSASQQQLRALMKQQLAAKNGDNSMKDKVKMLKAQKQAEQQKQYQTTSSSHQKVSSKSEPTSSSSSSFTAGGGGVPAGFFDEEPTPMPAQVAVAKNNELTNAMNDTKKSTEPKITKNVTVPLGFFDNVEEDFQAHGINYHHFQQKQTEILEEEVATFMHEIEDLSKEMNDYEEQVEQEEKSLQEEEEAFLQMSYITKYAALLKQSEKFVGKPQQEQQNGQKAYQREEEKVDVEKMLQEAEEIQSIAKVASSGKTQAVDRTTSLIHSIMKQKMLNKFAAQSSISSKRKEFQSDAERSNIENGQMVKKLKVEEPVKEQEEGKDIDNSEEDNEDSEEDEEEEDDYSPLDFVNFTGKY
jgi:hypothetical protein